MISIMLIILRLSVYHDTDNGSDLYGEQEDGGLHAREEEVRVSRCQVQIGVRQEAAAGESPRLKRRHPRGQRL